LIDRRELLAKARERGLPLHMVEEIFAQKLRALVERKKVRDYYDVWRMGGLEIDQERLAKLFVRKLAATGTEWHGLGDIFPDDLQEVLAGYWKRELGRLVSPVPDMAEVLGQLRHTLTWLSSLVSAGIPRS